MLKGIEVEDIFLGFSQNLSTDLTTNFTKFELSTSFRSRDITV